MDNKGVFMHDLATIVAMNNSEAEKTNTVEKLEWLRENHKQYLKVKQANKAINNN